MAVMTGLLSVGWWGSLGRSAYPRGNNSGKTANPARRWRFSSFSVLCWVAVLRAVATTFKVPGDLDPLSLIL